MYFKRLIVVVFVVSSLSLTACFDLDRSVMASQIGAQTPQYQLRAKGPCYVSGTFSVISRNYGCGEILFHNLFHNTEEREKFKKDFNVHVRGDANTTILDCAFVPDFRNCSRQGEIRFKFRPDKQNVCLLTAAVALGQRKRQLSERTPLSHHQLDVEPQWAILGDVFTSDVRRVFLATLVHDNQHPVYALAGEDPGGGVEYFRLPSYENYAAYVMVPGLVTNSVATLRYYFPAAAWVLWDFDNNNPAGLKELVKVAMAPKSTTISAGLRFVVVELEPRLM